jgi:hypothetical protein
MTKITGCSWSDIERSRWKQTRGCEVTPAKVKVYIERELKAWPVGDSCPKGFGNVIQAKAHKSKQR